MGSVCVPAVPLQWQLWHSIGCSDKNSGSELMGVLKFVKSYYCNLAKLMYHCIMLWWNIKLDMLVSYSCSKFMDF